jgi:hypothetical protein
VELRACPNVRGEGRVAAIFTRDPDEVEAFVRAWAGKPYGIYFGCGTRTRKRGTAEDVGEIPALWLDNDTTPKDELRAALLSCPYPPTFIIDSGRGRTLKDFGASSRAIPLFATSPGSCGYRARRTASTAIRCPSPSSTHPIFATN